MTWLDRFCLALWGIGSVLVFMSWDEYVPGAVGFLGYGLATAGALLSVSRRFLPRPLPKATGSGDAGLLDAGIKELPIQDQLREASQSA